MTTILVVLLVIAFVWACAATSAVWALRQKADVVLDAHNREVDGINKVGRWYENRVRELEEESALLAAQIVAGGSVAVRNAMPLPGRDAEDTWAFDATGLIAEKLDPRDVPSAL